LLFYRAIEKLGITQSQLAQMLNQSQTVIV
jgi:ribosome-binding protein aMBF1 (putative translation factor)